jgi:hypothetical protein
MRSPLGWWGQRQAKRRYMPRTARVQRTGTIAKVSVVALVIILVAAALLEMRTGGGAEAELADYARENRLDPLDLIEVAAQARRLVFLADVPSAAAPKRFAAQAVERLALGPGLDLVVLDVDSEEQPHIDRYLATSPEDASILMSRPRAIREDDAASRAFLDVYRAVWRVNQELGAHRRVRIVAADLGGWPPDRGTSLHEAARLFAARDEHMMNTVMERALARSPGARVLFFVGGLHALRSGGGRIQTGGTRPVETTWLAARMAERFPQDVFTILVDATPARALATEVATYRGTESSEAMRRAALGSGFALRASEQFDDVSRVPVRFISTTGLDFALEPRTPRFTEVADAYIYFGN